MSNDIPEAKEHRICKARQFPNSATFVTSETTSDLPVQLRVTAVPTYFQIVASLPTIFSSLELPSAYPRARVKPISSLIWRMRSWSAAATPLEPNTTSISSSVNLREMSAWMCQRGDRCIKTHLFVSGTKNQMKAAPMLISTPNRMKVPYFRWVIMSGVTWPTMKLFIQLDDAPSAIP